MSEAFIGVCRLLLALIFVAAGAAKLADRKGTARAVHAFGFPAGPARTLAYGLPVLELALAVALIPAGSARAAAAASAALILAFTAVVGVTLLRGRRPECNCFGRLQAAPIGGLTLARNLMLAALAGLVAWQRSSLGLADAAATLVAVAVAGQGWLWVELLRRYGRALRRIDTLASGGQNRPALAVEAVDGLRRPGLETLLVFTDAGCGPCTALYPEVGRWQQDLADRLTVAVIGRGDAETNAAHAAEHGIGRMVIQADRELAQVYGVLGTPAAVLLSPNGTIAAGPRHGGEEIRALLAETLSRPVEAERYAVAR